MEGSSPADLCVESWLLKKPFMLPLHPAGGACPELVEGLSTNGKTSESKMFHSP
jgi:hypothetical protein